MNRMRPFSALMLCLLCLSACGGASGFRKQLGVERTTPDEFAVIRRAPLEIPPPYAVKDLPAPNPGAARPQEKSPEDAARETLIGQRPAEAPLAASTNLITSPDRNQATTLAEENFLKKTGAADANSSVRATIDAETAKLHDRNKPVAERLFNFRGDSSVPSATVVDAKAEAQRIKENQASGKSVNDGETPSIEE